MKVAIGSWETPPVQCGPAYFIDELVKNLSKHVEVVLIVPSHSSIKENEKLLVKKIETLNIPVIRVSFFAVRASFLLRKLNVDLVHDNGVLGLSNFCPFIETWHHSDAIGYQLRPDRLQRIHTYREQLTLRGVRKANSVIAISQRAKDELTSAYSIPSSKIHVAMHGVDTNFFRPLSATTIYQRKNGVYLLYVGSLSPRKNIDSLIRALKKVLKKRGDVHLLIVGDGQEKNHLKQLTELLDLKSNITFLGSVSREQLLEIYNITDFIVLPSFIEGFGMTILEGLACEKPVIMTDVGISEIVKENNLGVVAEDFSSLSIAFAIESAMDGQFSNLRAFVEKNFTWTKTVERTLEIYKETLNGSDEC